MFNLLLAQTVVNVSTEGEGAAIFAGAGILLLLFFGVVALASLGLWIWSLIHCVSNKKLSDTNRVIGIILIVLLGLLGSLVYLFLPRDEGVEERSEAF